MESMEHGAWSKAQRAESRALRSSSDLAKGRNVEPNCIRLDIDLPASVPEGMPLAKDLAESVKERRGEKRRRRD